MGQRDDARNSFFYVADSKWGRRDWMGMGGICQQCKKRQTCRQRSRGQSQALRVTSTAKDGVRRVGE